MSGASTPANRLVDTVALAALARSSYEDHVFSTVPITVTRCCFEEIKRGAADGDKYSYRKGCQTVLRKIRNRGDNLHLYSTGVSCRDRHGYLKDNIGEISIARALEDNPSFNAVVSFDDDVIDGNGGTSEDLKDLFRGQVPQFFVAPANEPLYRLYDTGEISEEDFVQGTQRMIREMDWSDAENIDLFWISYGETFDH